MAGFQPTAAGQKLTAGILNDLLLIGATVFSATSNGAQSVPTRTTEAVGDAVIWDPPAVDLYGAWSSGAATRWTSPKAGNWTLAGGTSFAASTGGSFREAIWFQNGSLLSAGRSTPVMSTAIAATPITADARGITVTLAVGDYIELVPLQNSGTALTLAQGSLRPYMTVTYAGPSS